VSTPGPIEGCEGAADAVRADRAGVSERAEAGGALEGLALAERVAAIASDRKAQDIRVLDLRGLVAYTDALVVCSGNTERQTKAIHDAVHQTLKDQHGLLPRRVEGEREARWILMDYLDCVAHIFTPEARAFYRLDQLWGEAPAQEVG
jgi:ribosome-associated protein